MSTLQLTRTILDAICAHGEETYPYECCGVLLGGALTEGSVFEGWSISAAIRAGNTRSDSAHNRYQISPDELVKIEREARNRGLSIAGFYHSHPDHPAQWSATDLAEAHWLGCSYVITSVTNGKSSFTTSFLLTGNNEEEKRFVLESIRIVQEGNDRLGEKAEQQVTETSERNLSR